MTIKNLHHSSTGRGRKGCQRVCQRREAHGSRKDFDTWWRVKTWVFLMTLRDGRELVG